MMKNEMRIVASALALLTVCLAAGSSQAQNVAARVASDAAAIDRVAEASERDLPAGLLKRIVDQSIDTLRGPRPDGTYEYATWERFEASRITKDFSIQPRAKRMETVEMRGANVYRVIVGVPKRRLMVRPNRPVWIERIDVDYVGEGSAQSRQSSIPVGVWLQPGELKPVDLPTITRQATVRVIATADPKAGYSNIDVALAQARIVDSARSPYAAAMTQAKALLAAVEDRDVELIRTTAQRLRMALGAETAAGSAMTVVAPGTSGISGSDLQDELRAIDGLLRGSEAQRREGLDRLQWLIRRVGS
jgi:hypothetical protein